MKLILIIFILLVAPSYASINDEILNGYNKLETESDNIEEIKTYINAKLKSREQIPGLLNYIASQKVEDVSVFYWQLMNVDDFGENIHIDNFLNSIEYKYILKNISHSISFLTSDDTIRVFLHYNLRNKKDAETHSLFFEFPIKFKCKLSKTEKEKEPFFGISFPVIESVSVTYNIYSCTTNSVNSEMINNIEAALGSTLISQEIKKMNNKRIEKERSYVYAKVNHQNSRAPSSTNRSAGYHISRQQEVQGDITYYADCDSGGFAWAVYERKNRWYTYGAGGFSTATGGTVVTDIGISAVLSKACLGK